MGNKRTPKQDRGIETKTRICDAGFELFSQKGLHGTSSREIAKGAGVSIGSFYSYFKDKKELFMTLLKRHRSEVLKILQNFSEENTPDKDPGKLMGQLVKEIFNAHQFIYEFDKKADMIRNTDPEIDSILKGQEAQVLSQSTVIMEIWAKKLRKKDVALSAMMAFLTIKELMHTLPRIVSKDNETILLDELTDMLTRYLFKS